MHRLFKTLKMQRNQIKAKMLFVILFFFIFSKRKHIIFSEPPFFLFFERCKSFDFLFTRSKQKKTNLRFYLVCYYDDCCHNIIDYYFVLFGIPLTQSRTFFLFIFAKHLFQTVPTLQSIDQDTFKGPKSTICVTLR